MRHGTFSGILILDDGEDPAEFADFGNADREVIDRLMQIGAVTHRHDAHAKLPDPTASAIVTVSDVGGMIPADTSFWVCYTLLDSYGGETLPSPAVTVTTDPALEAPTTELVGSASYTVGCLLADTYLYAISFVDAAGGETELGPAVAVEREPGFEFGEITISNLSADLLPGSSWRLYRNSGVSWDLLAAGNDDLYLDDGFTVPDCNTNPPAEFNNGTNRTNRLSITVPESAVPDDITGFRIYVSDDGSFESPCLFGEFIVADRGEAWPMPFPQFLGGRPPEVSQSIPGASKIDPDTDILDWHWKRPVAGSAELPAGDLGDVRFAVDDLTLYGFDGDDWFPLTGGGGDGEGANTHWRAPVDTFDDLPAGDPGDVRMVYDGGTLGTNVVYSAGPFGAATPGDWELITGLWPYHQLGVVGAYGSAATSYGVWSQQDRHVKFDGRIDDPATDGQPEFAFQDDPFAFLDSDLIDGGFAYFVVASSDGPITVRTDGVTIAYDDYLSGWPDTIYLDGISFIAFEPPLP